MPDLDATDIKILRRLQRDGRISNAELADRVNLSQSACLRRVRRLEDAGVISGYVALLDPSSIGQACDVFVEITLNSQSEESLEAFEEAVRACPEVMECYLMSGDADYLLRLVASGTGDYERIHKTRLSRFPGVSRIRSSFALRVVSKKTEYDLDTLEGTKA
ncbi:MAG: Lrp/AsnC family transcriptional regulator [Rhodovibrionaceae bacterium]|nr:Lrp/AsnC family transcriptional regulator [Rhodovibrionaceae bacterium]